MIEQMYYLSKESSLDKAVEDTELSADEIEYIVGRFTKISHRTGKLRGKVNVFFTGKVEIRHHFTNKLLWSNQ